MFLKPFRVKSSSQMKGSDKKKFKAEIRKKFAYFADPDVDMDALNDLIPNKEELVATKIETFSGDSVFLYTKQKNVVLFFELEKDKVIYPTIYTLWQLPELMPSMKTHWPVAKKLANGADLMLPGIVVDESLGIRAYNDGKIKKGDSMSVCLVENKAAIAVGDAALSSEDMYMSGKRGKALLVMHCFGDQLWTYMEKPKLPDLGPPQGMDFYKDDADEQEEAATDVPDDNAEAVNAEESSNAETENGAKTDEVPELEEKLNEVNVNEEEEEKEVLDMDEILEIAFLRACKTTAKKAEFPILTSNFFRGHIVPATPPGLPDLDIKKTKYKKVSKYLAEKQKEGILTLKEPKKGVEVVSAINQDHEKLIKFKVVKYDNPDAEGGNGEQEFKPPVVTELYIVTGNEVAKFFKAVKVPKGTGLDAQEVKTLIRNYVYDNNLTIPDNQKQVNLDPILAEAVLVKGENNVVTFDWSKLHSRITAKMTRGTAINFNDGNGPIVQKGKLDLVEMLVAKRSGNKKVTLIHNLDVYGIKPAEFAHKLQVGVAASTTIHEAPNKKKSNGSPVIEVLVQGNQVAFAGKLLLEEYKLPKKYIRGLELAAKAKGQK